MSGPPFKRIGPRPLGLHLGLSSSTLSSALAALPLARENKIPWLDGLQEEADALAEDLKSHDLAHLMQVVGERAHFHVSEMLSGIKKYHAHSYTRSMEEPALLHQVGAMRLLDYAPKAPLGSPVVFIVPSLVNRDYILDLMEGRSFVRALAAAGLRPILVSWGAPGTSEQSYNIEDYLLKQLLPAFDMVCEANPGQTIHMLGYCMGGTLAVAAAQLRQSALSSLITLASPWNFHADLGAAAKMFLSQKMLWSSVVEQQGNMPVDILQSFFASLDPNLCLKKFGLFNRMDMDSQKAREFVAIEDWLNDGVPLARRAAMDCFTDWYTDNRPYRGKWTVDGQTINPEKLNIPVMIAVPKSDRIVPAASALGLAEQLSKPTVVTPPSGHIGMVVGRQAARGLWQDVIDWVTG
ncbi:alpha/beta fold hydrolase [Sneathiella sp.]|jgi:polyhydroxyalkanoate synthase|uniref:alpha/beta fold hydrolase n=1 Tax=Sneathiella sp. TaxID=1964365 RepID=UPI0039E37E11